jgi:large subunit ribosomal protein L5
MAQAVRRAAKSAAKSSSSAVKQSAYSPLTYTPPVALKLGPTHASRLRSHYDTTLAEDLMYMHYQHHDANYIPPLPPTKRQHDLENDPYAKGRPPPRPRGNKPLRPLATNVGCKEDNAKQLARSVTQLQEIQLHIMSKDALQSKATLLAPMFQLRALTGSTKGEGGHTTTMGVQLIRGRKNLPQWRIRRGVPCGVKVTLKGDKMFDLLGTLVEFVLPRLREWNGIVMPAPSANRDSPSMTSGVVSVGLTPENVELFPQVSSLISVPFSLSSQLTISSD